METRTAATHVAGSKRFLIIWIFMAGFTAAFIGTNLGEGETTAALRGGGGSAVLVLIYALVLMRVLGITSKRTGGSEL